MLGKALEFGPIMKSPLIVFMAASLAHAATFYVSTEGRSGWSGRLAASNAKQSDGPLPSLKEARDAVRALRRSGNREPVTVLVRAGRYFLTEPLVLTPEDSGNTGAPVVCAAYPHEHVILSGGRKITGWKPGKGKIWNTTVSGGFRQLFVGGRRAQRARMPNHGFYRIEGPSSQDNPFRLKFRGDDIHQSWANSGVEVVALLAWAELRMPIISVDESTHTTTLAGTPQPSNQEINARYWIENARDALDAPGEWYHDEKTGVLSYWPASGDDLMKDDVIAPAIQRLVQIEGKPEAGRFVHDITFRGLDFRHVDWTIGPRGDADTQAAIEAVPAFEASGAQNISIEHCTFAQMGGYAIWFGRGSKGNQIAANEIFDMGAGGIKIGETVLRENKAEQNGNNVITDNNIHDLGWVYPAAVGIWVGQSSRNTISHNHIHDLFYTAISVGWTWGYAPNQCNGNKIEFNNLHDIGKQMLSDMGAVYTLGVQPGTTIRNNLIHDVYSFTYGGWGIYPDEGSSEILIENNIVYRTKSAGFHQHYGRDNIVRNNIFAFGKEFQLMRTRAEPHLSFTFQNNIVYFDQGRLLGTNWSGNQFKMNRNVYWDVRGEEMRFDANSWSQWKKRGQDMQSMIADPLFVNAGSYDFRLEPESPALRLGFRQIDMTSVGPREPTGAMSFAGENYSEK